MFWKIRINILCIVALLSNRGRCLCQSDYIKQAKVTKIMIKSKNFLYLKNWFKGRTHFILQETSKIFFSLNCFKYNFDNLQ